MQAFVRAFVALVAVTAAAVALVVVGVDSTGLGTRAKPSAVEAAIARAVRALATPRHLRAVQNPVPLTDEVRTEGRHHFADHCASCHANDGSGDTALGLAFYPPAPDMRADATQRLSDGEMFSIIENGIRLTGMPAWGDGTAEGERSTWALVHFIRSLSSLTSTDIADMESRNPRSPDDLRAEEEARRFLAGDDVSRPAAVASPGAGVHEGGHR
jgi:mono/diheme cytochrome c family protein